MLYAAAEYIVLFGAMYRYQCHMHFHLADQAVTECLCTSGTTAANMISWHLKQGVSLNTSKLILMALQQQLIELTI